ncbi:MAG: hypothetical protein FJW90_06505 [Actinobacteria bacterium]|nr:hypothetical protein [Actinomycetota bacterium]
MNVASKAISATRLAGLLAFSAFGLHQLRYAVAHGEETGAQLSAQGHDYLAGALPILATLLAAVIAATVLRARLAPAPSGNTHVRRALLSSAAILAVYGSQELLEGALASGHPAGLAALTAGAGWVALPLALLLGACTALVLAALERIEAVLAPKPRRLPRLRPPRSRGRALPELRPASGLSPLAFGQARRPPPAPAIP